MISQLEDTTQGLEHLITAGSETKIVITTHHKPDADALGSSLGLFHFLNGRGLDVQVISPTDYPAFLKWMPGEESVLNFEENPERSSEIIALADLIFCLDFNDLSRINEMGALVDQSGALTVMIDHHRNPSGFDTHRFWTIHTSSTSELIYNFIVKFGSEAEVSKSIGECLYAGIMADTGSFRFSSTSGQTHRIVASLMDRGVVPHEIHSHLNDNFTLNRFKLMGYVLYEKLQVLPEYNTALVALSREEIQKFGIQTGDTEGFVNFGLGIQGIKLSVLIIDRTKLIKMSFRSKDDFPCNELASKHFSGGGHLNAAGGSSTESLDEVVDRFLKILPEYADKLVQ
ncbi:MAG: bifunctional oligoribonuclease/PAP phosphatase NrnA [Flavobacteriales bacterium]|nr:bifunctional oligoribonuclease/PAP phosphatase NrnA [Flavobacteriales bacterium]